MHISRIAMESSNVDEVNVFLMSLATSKIFWKNRGFVVLRNHILIRIVHLYMIGKKII